LGILADVRNQLVPVLEPLLWEDQAIESFDPSVQSVELVEFMAQILEQERLAFLLPLADIFV
jgi:hypothetical protein